MEPHVALLTLDVLVSLSRNDESGSGPRIEAVGKLYGRFLQTKYSHVVPQLSVRLPAYPLVATLCASIRGEGRGEGVADRWSALLLKKCSSAPKTAATEAGSGSGAGGQCEKRLAHHALVSLSVLVSSAAATRTAPSTGGAIDMLPVATDLLGCIETFFRQDEGERPDAARSAFVLPAITPFTLPLFLDLVLRVSSLFDSSVSAARGSSSSSQPEPQDEAWVSSIASLGAGLRLRQRLAFALWQLELAGVAGGWSRSATNAATQRFLSHLAMALPAVRKRIQRDVLPVAIGGGRDDKQEDADSDAAVEAPPADSVGLPSAPASCAEVVVSAAALVAQLRRLCALVKTREQERGVRLSQHSFGRGGRRRGGRSSKYRTSDTDDDSDSDGLQDVAGDDAEDRHASELYSSAPIASHSRQAAAHFPTGTASESPVGSASPGQQRYGSPPQRKRVRPAHSAGTAHGRARKQQRRRLVQSHHGDGSQATGAAGSDDEDLDVASELAGRDPERDSAGEEEEEQEEDVSDDGNGSESEGDAPAAASTTTTPAAANSRSARLRPSLARRSVAESGSGRGRRGRGVLSRVTYAVAALAEVLMSAPPAMRAPLLEDASSQAARNANQAQLGVSKAIATEGSTTMVVATSTQPSMRPQFLLPLESRPTAPAATANKEVHESSQSSEFMGSMPRVRARRDEAVRAANLADGYDSSDSDNDDDGLGGMRGYRAGSGAVRKKSMRPLASADAFRAVPRDPTEGQRDGEAERNRDEDGTGAQSKAAALIARMSANPTTTTTAWGQSPDPRR